VRLLGTARARELALLRERLDATGAAVGLVTEVVRRNASSAPSPGRASRTSPLAVSVTKRRSIYQKSRAALLERIIRSACANGRGAGGVDAFVNRH
jgi:enoyl-CoA hydratase/carnithine racemase